MEKKSLDDQMLEIAGRVHCNDGAAYDPRTVKVVALLIKASVNKIKDDDLKDLKTDLFSSESYLGNFIEIIKNINACKDKKEQDKIKGYINSYFSAIVFHIASKASDLIGLADVKDATMKKQIT